MEIFNRQRTLVFNQADLIDFTEKTVKLCPEAKGKTLSIAFISDREMRRLNREFRKRDATTDVLSFPFEPDELNPNSDYLGDIAISGEQALKQAAENGMDPDIEIKQLILHGILHLCGYDHETDDGEMNRRELRLRELLGIS